MVKIFCDKHFEILHSGVFKIIEIQNFLQPRWRYSVINMLKSFILELLRSPQLKKNSTMMKHPNNFIYKVFQSVRFKIGKSVPAKSASHLFPCVKITWNSPLLGSRKLGIWYSNVLTTLKICLIGGNASLEIQTKEFFISLMGDAFSDRGTSSFFRVFF